MDTLKRRRWKAEINNEFPQSTTLGKDKSAMNQQSLERDRITAIVRIEGVVNIMVSPLLLEAIQR